MGTPLAGAGAITIGAASGSSAVVTAAGSGGGGGGANLLFSYPNFSSTTHFISSGGGFETPPNPNVVQLCGDVVHDAGQGWYYQKQTITTFSTTFQISVGPGTGSPQAIGYGFSFTVHNDPDGTSSGGDSNGLGFGQYSPATGNPLGTATTNGVTIAINSTPNGGTGNGYFGPFPSATGCYLWGGPFLENGLSPTQDIYPQGIDLWTGHNYNCSVVYDGTILEIIIQDATTLAMAYASWPVNIPAIVNAATAWVGFGAGAGESSPATPQTVNNWYWYAGYNERLARPTFSVSPGQYATAQTVTLSGPVGATIYYTTNGNPATTQSTPYTGPITVSASTIITAICSQSNWTNSYQAQADYQIQTSGLPKINYPSGFSSAGVPSRIACNGTAALSGTAIALTDNVNNGFGEVGSAYYVAPVIVSAFSTTFEFQFSSGNGSNQGGFCFIIQNQILASTTGVQQTQSSSYPGVSLASVSGGPNSLGFPVYAQNAIGAGYAGIMQSVAVVFDEWNNKVNLLSNGALQTGGGSTPTGITFSSGHLMQATLAYDGTTLSLTLKDTSTSATYSPSWTVDIPSLVAGSTAYVGFSASYESPVVEMTLTNWTYIEN